MFSCRHLDMSSDRLLRRLLLVDFIIISFSVRQRSHLLEELLYGLALEIMDHLMLKFMELSLRCQMYLDSSVLLVYFLWRNVSLC